MRQLFSFSFNGLDKTETTYSKRTTLDSDWLVQGDVVMLAKFDIMFEIFKQVLL